MTDSKTSGRVFVIGPIGEKHGEPESMARETYEQAIEVLEEIIVPACRAFGLDALRADEIERTGEIPEQVFRHLRDSQIVIADLTGANPNVMYELGLRHTTGKLTIQLGERGRLPFDVSAIRTILFKRSPAGLVEARKALTKALALGLEDGGDPVAATRIWHQSVMVEIEPELRAPEGAEEAGFLEKLADFEEGLPAASNSLGKITSISNEVRELFQAATSETKRAAGSARLKLQAAERLASRLEDPASRLEVAVGEYLDCMARMNPGMTYILARLIEEPDQLANAPTFISNARQLVEVGTTALQSGGRFRDSIRGVGDASRLLRRATHRVAAALGNLVDSARFLDEWGRLLNALPESESGGE